MEEGGFLTPHRTDPATGYRYHDMQNVAAIGQYQRLQSIGLSRAETADDWREWMQPPSQDHRMTVCIPVVPGPDADEDPGLRFSPETEALSVLGFGDYSE